MPDDETTLETEDKAAAVTPDWETQYKALQPEYTKNQQALAEERKVWEDEQAALARLAEKFPHLFEEDEPEDGDDELELDEAERPLTRAEFDAWQKQQEQTQRQQSAQQQYDTDLQTFLNGRELDEFAERAIRAAPVKNAEELKAVVDGWFEKYGGEKQRPRVPHTPANGQAATQVPNWDEMTPGEENRYLAERVRGHQAQT